MFSSVFLNCNAKLRIFSDISKEYLTIIDTKDTAVEDFFTSKALKRLCDIRGMKAT